jgi:hypothetical protein
MLVRSNAGHPPSDREVASRPLSPSRVCPFRRSFLPKIARASKADANGLAFLRLQSSPPARKIQTPGKIRRSIPSSVRRAFIVSFLYHLHSLLPRDADTLMSSILFSILQGLSNFPKSIRKLTLAFDLPPSRSFFSIYVSSCIAILLVYALYPNPQILLLPCLRVYAVLRQVKVPNVSQPSQNSEVHIKHFLLSCGVSLLALSSSRCSKRSRIC